MEISFEEKIANYVRQEVIRGIRPVMDELSELRREVNPLCVRETFTTKEASLQLGLSEYHLRELLRTGVIEGKKDNADRWRVSRQELQRYKDHGPRNVKRA